MIVDDAPGQIAALLDEVGRTDVNVEDLRLEHASGHRVGMVEISVLPGRRDELVAALTAAGWKVVGVDAGTLHRQVAGRDARDATVSTFDRPADGVALVDSTELDFEQTVAAVLAAVEDQAGIPAVKGGRR